MPQLRTNRPSILTGAAAPVSIWMAALRSRSKERFKLWNCAPAMWKARRVWMPLTYSRIPDATSRWAFCRSALIRPIRRRLRNANGSASGMTRKTASVMRQSNTANSTAARTNRIRMTATWGSICWERSPTVW